MDPLSAVVARVFPTVLSEFAFLFGDPTGPESVPDLDETGYLARIPFWGLVNGAISVAVPESLAVEIAANALGLETADPEAVLKAGDAVREVASVLGGHAATAWAGILPQVVLSPPEVSTLGRPDWERLLREPGTRCFSVNERPAMVRLQLDEAAAAP